MRKTCSVVMALVLSVVCLEARMDLPLVNGKSGLELNGSLGYASVEAVELVFDEGVKLSELQWSSSVLLGGIGGAWKSGKWKINGSYRFSLSALDGELVDYDWADWRTSEWTDRSEGDAEVEISGFDISASYNMYRRRGRYFSAVVGYRKENWYWEDDGGSYIYSEGGGFRNAEGEFPDGTGIEYDQDLVIPYVGVEGSFPAGNITLGGYFHYSPMASVDAEDTHLYTDASAEDSVDRMKYIALGASAKMRLKGRIYASLNIDYLSMPEEKGDSKLLAVGETIDDGAGVEAGMTSISIVVGTTL